MVGIDSQILQRQLSGLLSEHHVSPWIGTGIDRVPHFWRQSFISDTNIAYANRTCCLAHDVKDKVFCSNYVASLHVYSIPMAQMTMQYLIMADDRSCRRKCRLRHHLVKYLLTGSFS